MLVTIYLSNGPRKEKEKAHKRRLVVPINLEPNFSIKSPPYLPMYQCYSKYNIYYKSLHSKSYLLFIVQLIAHGKIAKFMVIIIM
jgi:hypothetical protein